jgi:hypothetical protein
MSIHSHSGEHTFENGTKLDKNKQVSGHRSHDDISTRRTSKHKGHSNRSMQQSINQIMYELENPRKDGAANTDIHNKKYMAMLKRPYIIVFAAILIFIIIFASLIISNNKEAGRVESRSENTGSVVSGTRSGNVQKDTSKVIQSDSQQKITDMNIPPNITSADIVPVILSTGIVMKIKASASDVEGDDIQFDYEWSVNGEYAGKESEISRPLKRGDSIEVKISPYDDVGYGTPIVLRKDIHNTPPRIIGGKSKINGSLYSYQLEATDNDHDTLTYALDSAPEGMIIDSSGKITWTVPPEFKGKINFTVTIDDGYDGKASQQLTISIKDSETL